MLSVSFSWIQVYKTSDYFIHIMCVNRRLRVRLNCLQCNGLSTVHLSLLSALQIGTGLVVNESRDGIFLHIPLSLLQILLRKKTISLKNVEE